MIGLLIDILPNRIIFEFGKDLVLSQVNVVKKNDSKLPVRNMVNNDLIFRLTHRGDQILN